METDSARCILGNHEVGLLATAVGLRRPSPRDTTASVLHAPDAAEWLEWLRRLPLAQTGRIGGRRFAMVHAALAPEWDLSELEDRARSVEARLRSGGLDELRAFLATPCEDDADRDALERLTHCRSVDRKGRWSSRAPATRRNAWHRRWRRRKHDYGVVYGHWALQGLHVAPGLRGLDTGCVHHGRGHDGYLTAWLPDGDAADPFQVPDPGRMVQEKAARAYYQEVLQKQSGGVDSA
jgi:bis(5'-nucleosyl)-tetraphosphatase (symmetrical)